MDLDIDRNGNALVVRLQGEIDLCAAEALRPRLDKEIERQKAKHLVFNLRSVEFIDSSGIGFILGRYKRVKAQGGKVALAGPNQSVRRIIELSGMYKLMEGYANEAEALRSLEGGKTG
ncbi:anti-sigma F factor antagonist [Heliobacterium gestii]|uniref:Anti-sigma F factor antagonist n=1 Tax=Heliomicrobium gestii TaxID=2699 RepID=A0A845L9S3_HELGE|nr:anti-sigma F factor antagonist [Heliomicrobium gestii]MBM7865160.1 stage II sporulation protein AA (anti-sigma F factor antagonist) [Heliomicrobium gestii]MZP41429.1 anti-sigma F factor antagonist [Heliomicrobium gestii]